MELVRQFGGFNAMANLTLEAIVKNHEIACLVTLGAEANNAFSNESLTNKIARLMNSGCDNFIPETVIFDRGEIPMFNSFHPTARPLNRNDHRARYESMFDEALSGILNV